MKGSTFKRCACKDADGRQLGVACPRLRGTRHGSWYFAARVPGQRHPVKRGGFSTQAAAEKALRALQARVSGGVDVGAGAQLVGDFLDDWLAGKVGLSTETRTTYERHLRIYLKPALGKIRLEELRRVHIEDMYAAMRSIGKEIGKPSPVLRAMLKARQVRPELDRPMAAANVRRVHATLMSALNSAVRDERILRNPGQHVELASGKAPRAVVWTAARVELWRRTGKRYPVAVWTPEQAGAFLDAVAAERLYALYHLIAFRGLRRGEAVGLAWADVDLDRALARVRGTKSETSDRTITLDVETVAVLRAHRARQLEERLAWGRAWVDTGQVFTREDGSAVLPSSVGDRFDRLVRNADLPPIRLHDLRHTAASLTYRATRDLKVVSELLGHSGIQITGDIYTSVFEDVDREAAEAAAQLVPRSPAARATAVACPSGAHRAPLGGQDRGAAYRKPQVTGGGAGGARTHDRGIMSTPIGVPERAATDPG
ncbi:MAG: tyrosine-type recombinase/integrase [Candidatus Dormibacteria bacterium]